MSNMRDVITRLLSLQALREEIAFCRCLGLPISSDRDTIEAAVMDLWAEGKKPALVIEGDPLGPQSMYMVIIEMGMTPDEVQDMLQRTGDDAPPRYKV